MALLAISSGVVTPVSTPMVGIFTRCAPKISVPRRSPIIAVVALSASIASSAVVKIAASGLPITVGLTPVAPCNAPMTQPVPGLNPSGVG